MPKKEKKRKKSTKNKTNVRGLKSARKIDILVKDEDKTGTDIMKMSDFFSQAVQNLSHELTFSSGNIAVRELPISNLAIINNALQITGMFRSSTFDLVPDFAALPKGLQEKYKLGKLVLGESKQVDGNLRAVLVDAETNQRVKDITLKRVQRGDAASELSRDMITQLQLRQISNKLEFMGAEQSYLIDFTRNQSMLRPFLDARDFLLSAQNAADESTQRKNLENAAERMQTAINAVYVDLTTIEGELAKEGKKPWYRRLNRSNIDMQISRLVQDMEVVTRYIGVQLQIFHHLGKDDEKRVLIDVYKARINRFCEKGVVDVNKSLALFIHENIRYSDSNMNEWYYFEKDVNKLLTAPYEKDAEKDLYVLTVEEE